MRKLEYNALKGDGPYRQGQHDALRFARDAVEGVLTGTDEAAPLLADTARQERVVEADAWRQ